MKSLSIFHYLDTTDSTNNYAMRMVHEGLAKHGMAWFAHEQTAGKGQRGKKWNSNPGENIMMSIAFNPPKAFFAAPFLFNAVITVACRDFFDKLIPDALKIKWPNDLWVGDRKAGGILIENSYQGSYWNWSVVGIGFNVNQQEFSNQLKNPVSLRQLTGKSYDAVQLARELQLMLLDAIEGFDEPLGANAEKVVCFTPMGVLLSQEKYLPIRYCPLQVELELVTNANDAFAPGGSLANAYFELSDVQVKVDLVTLDNWLDNEYAQHLLSGRSLPINFSTFTTA